VAKFTSVFVQEMSDTVMIGCAEKLKFVMLVARGLPETKRTA
jgi:hypothetical protein